MSFPLRILCAATEAAFASIAQALASESVVECHRVGTLPDLEVALNRDWDVVIATTPNDVSEPLFVLHRIRALNDLPFLVIGNHLSAAEAVLLIKAGADDYLEFDDLARLPVKLAQLCSAKSTKSTAIACRQILPQQGETIKTLRARIAEQQQEFDRHRARSHFQTTFLLDLASATSVREAAALLSPLCEAFGWDAGEVWVATASALLPIAQWCSRTLAEFKLPCSSAEALIPVSVDAARLLEPIETRLGAADAQGLQTVWSIPINAGSDRLGVLVVYSRKLQRPQPNFHRLAANLSARLGQLLKRQQSELALHQLAAIVASTEDGIISTDAAGYILSWNAGAERIYGYSAAEAIGQLLTQLIYPSSDRIWGEAALSDAIAYHPVKHQHKSGELIDVLMTLSLIRTEQQLSGFAIIAKPIRTYPSLDRLKDEFISTISHELRTPIAALHGSIELLLSGKLGDLSDRGQRLLQLAARNSDRLIQLVNNIFDLERLTSGQIELLPQFCQVETLIEQAAIAVQPAARQASINLRLHLQPVQIFADPQRITQVLTNLLGNAIKFSAAGDTIWLTVEQRSSLALSGMIPATASAESYVVIQVKDEGLGIPADRLEAIFQRFGQADASDARRQTGAGLSLTLCRTIAHRHQGHLWVESKLGQGSSFYLALPIALSAFLPQIGNTDSDRRVKNLLEVGRGS